MKIQTMNPLVALSVWGRWTVLGVMLSLGGVAAANVAAASEPSSAALAVKPSLQNFLGTAFGDKAWLGEDWLRLKRPFGPFGWVKIVSNGMSKQRRIEAEIAYLLDAGPEGVVSQGRKVCRLFEQRYGIVFEKVDDRQCIWHSVARDGLFRVDVEVRKMEDGSNTKLNLYGLRMNVVKAGLGEDPPVTCINRKLCPWSKVFKPIRIARREEGDESRWVYAPPVEPTTEEQIQKAIAAKDESLVPYRAGYPGSRYGWSSPSGCFLASEKKSGNDGEKKGRNCYTGCTEAEADSFHVENYSKTEFSGYFSRYCSEAEMHRMETLAATPHRMRPRQPGEKRHHSAGAIDGQILPGDGVFWTTKDGDWCNGIACAEDDAAGRYVEEMKCHVKDISITYLAREEDYKPTEKTLECQRRIEELSRRRKEFQASLKPGDDKDALCPKVKEYVDWLHGQMRAGNYRSIHYSVFDLPATRESAKRAVKRQERQAEISWQLDVRRNLRDAFVRNGFKCWSSAGDEERIKARRYLLEHFNISRMELYDLLGYREWVELSMTFGDRQYNLEFPFRPFHGYPKGGDPYGKYVVKPGEDVGTKLRESNFSWEHESFGTDNWGLYLMMVSVVESPGPKQQFEERCASLARYMADGKKRRLIRFLLCKRLALEYGQDFPGTWTLIDEILKQMKAAGDDPVLGKEAADVERISKSRWRVKCMGK